jgi:NADH-quinone oxidoreductase subunit N
VAIKWNIAHNMKDPKVQKQVDIGLFILLPIVLFILFPITRTLIPTGLFLLTWGHQLMFTVSEVLNYCYVKAAGGGDMDIVYLIANHIIKYRIIEAISLALLGWFLVGRAISYLFEQEWTHTLIEIILGVIAVLVAPAFALYVLYTKLSPGRQEALWVTLGFLFTILYNIFCPCFYILLTLDYQIMFTLLEVPNYCYVKAVGSTDMVYLVSNFMVSHFMCEITLFTLLIWYLPAQGRSYVPTYKIFSKGFALASIFYLCFIFFSTVKDVAEACTMGNYSWADLGSADVISDSYVISAKAILLCFTQALINFSSVYAKQQNNYDLRTNEENTTKVYLILIIGIASIAGLCLMSTFNIIMFIVLLEGFSFIIIWLVGSSLSNTVDAANAMIKYMLFNIVATFVLMFGFYSILKAENDFGFRNLQWLVQMIQIDSSNQFTLGVFCVITAFMIKFGAYPFSFFLPDVYNHAPLMVVCYLAVHVKFVLFILFLRVNTLCLQSHFHLEISPFIIIFSIGCMIAGALLAYSETYLKKFIFYASINQFGFVLIGFCINDLRSLAGSFLFMMIYLVSTLIIIGSIIRTEGINTTNTISDLSKSKDNYYAMRITFVAFFSSIITLAGLPPTIGFFGKLFLLEYSFTHGFLVLTTVGLITSLFTLFYYMSFGIAFLNAYGKCVDSGTFSSANKNVIWTVDLILILFLTYPSNMAAYENKSFDMVFWSCNLHEFSLNSEKANGV